MRHLVDPARLGRHTSRVKETTIAATIVADMLQYLEQRGISTDDARRYAGIGSQLTAGVDARIPGSLVERLWVFAVESTGDSLVGLHMAEAYSPGALDILGYVILSCATIGDVLDRLTRYAPLLNDGMHIDVVRDSGKAWCRCSYAEGMNNYLLRNPDQAIDTTWAGLARELRRLTAKPLVASEIWFRHNAPSAEKAREYDRVMGAPVRFGMKEDRFIIPLGHLDEQLRSANPALLESFERHANVVMSTLDNAGTRSHKVAKVLASRLKGVVPTLSEIARELAMSDRNLQRALRNDGTSYQKLLDRVRRDLAMSHLSNPGTSAAQVGFLLGFSEPSAFHRAFRRWTGAVPSAFRARSQAT